MIGANEGRQNNILLFEAGYVFRASSPGVERIVTVAVHPLVVAPAQITYTDTTRSPVTQTLNRFSRLVTSRNGVVAQLTGVFGVEARGFGAYQGTGYTRWQRFYNEVVRWSDCRSEADLDRLIDDLTGSPGIRARLIDFDPARCTPFVNFYDLLNNRQFTCALNWTDGIGARNGGATGNRSYTLQVVEAGPVVASGISEQAIQVLFSGQQIFSGAVNALRSYDPESVANSLLSVPTAILSSMADATSALADQADQARALFGANRRATTAQPLVGFLGAANDVVEQGKRITEDGQADLQGVDPAAGTITNWLAARPAQFAGLDAGDALDQVLGVQDAAGTLERMGAFFALSQSEYGTILATGGASQPTIAAATVPHTVTTYDTANALEQRFGVDFASILQINGMLPDEALFPGTVLQVPVVQFSGPRFIAGLPTFGSQVGIAAWGSDATLDLQVDDGDLVVIAGQDVIVQGVTFLEEQIGADLLDLAQVTDASASPTIIGAKVRQTLLSDLRIAAVPRVDVASKPGAAGIAIAVQAQPINVRSAVYVGG